MECDKERSRTIERTFIGAESDGKSQETKVSLILPNFWVDMYFLVDKRSFVFIKGQWWRDTRVGSYFKYHAAVTAGEGSFVLIITSFVHGP